MSIAIIILVLGVAFVYGGIKGISITGLLQGKVQSRTPPAGAVDNSSSGSTTNPAVGTQPSPGQASGSVNANAQQWQLLLIAQKYLGVPYKWGGNDPRVGIDCSRFVQLVYGTLGITLPRTSQLQFNVGKPVDLSQLQIGDVIFTEPTATGPGHEGIYVGNSQVQESPHTGEVNEIIPLDKYLKDGYVGTRRYL
jgi:peptidoglycan DL-endopeptidase CwlO